MLLLIVFICRCDIGHLKTTANGILGVSSGCGHQGTSLVDPLVSHELSCHPELEPQSSTCVPMLAISCRVQSYYQSGAMFLFAGVKSGCEMLVACLAFSFYCRDGQE